MTMFRGLLDPLSISGRWMFWLVVSCILAPHPALSVDTGPVCAIDMGSNNFKLIIGEMKGGKYRQHHYMKDKLSVGSDMSKTGVIDRTKLNEIRQILGKYLSVCDSARILTRSAVATAAFREAKNRRDVVEMANSLQMRSKLWAAETQVERASLLSIGTIPEEPSQAQIEGEKGDKSNY